MSILCCRTMWRKGGEAVNCLLIIVMDSGVARALYLPDTRLVVPVVLLAPPLVHHHRCHDINIYRVDFWRKTIACDAKKKKTPEPKSSSNPRDILSWRVYKGRLPYNTPILIHITIRNFVWCFFHPFPAGYIYSIFNSSKIGRKNDNINETKYCKIRMKDI